MTASKTEQEKNKRKYIRLDTVFPVEIRVVDRKTGKNLTNIIQCFTRDVSLGGMCIEISAASDEILQLVESEDIKLSITLKLPFYKRPINAFANISWKKIVKEGAFIKLILGINYDNIIKEDQNRLFKYAKSRKRKPYKIAFVLFLLLAYGAYVSYNYNLTSGKAKKLSKNLKKSVLNEKESVDELHFLKKKEIELKSALASHKDKIAELNEKMEQMADNLKDESKDNVITEIQNENKILKLTVERLNRELNFLKKRIQKIESRKLYLKISGNENQVLITKDINIDVITLNNNTTLLGNVVSEAGLKIVFNLLDGTEVNVYSSDIKSVNRVGVSDSKSIVEKLPIKQIMDTKMDEKRVNTIKAVKIKRQSVKPTLQVELLKKIEYDTFLYFLNEVNKKNGLIKDANDSFSPCSIAAVGFALTSYCIAESRGWMSKDEAYSIVLKTLKTFYKKVKHERGFFYHFVGMNSGRRVWNSEVSSIDTVLFICGALVCGEYFKNTEVEKLVQKIYDRIDWKWMTDNKSLLCLGWKPETGFLPYFWDSYNEGMLAYVLAIGADKNAIDPAYWKAWRRPIGRYFSKGKESEFVYCTTGSLFVYQFPHLWLDLKDFDDNGVDYWENSILATYANKQFCYDNKDKFKTYKKGFWGLSASMGPRGYKGYGAEPGIVLHDGTVAPYSVLSALPYAPEIAIPTIKKMYDEQKDRLYGFYGFKDAFNLDRNWYSRKYIGIDQGSALLAIENYLTGFVWKYFMKTKPVQNWLKKIKK